MLSPGYLSRRVLVIVAALGAFTPAIAAKNKRKTRKRKRGTPSCPQPIVCPVPSDTVAIRNVSGPACTSPQGICAEFQFSGTLEGTGAFVATGIEATVDTPTTGVVWFTADMTLTTADGTLFFKDAGAFGTTGEENFVDLATVIGGDGRWAGATGQIRITGTFPTASQDGSATYTALISTP